METRRIRIENEYFYVDRPSDFIKIIDQKLGWDANDYLEDLFTEIFDYLDEAVEYGQSSSLSIESKVAYMLGSINELLERLD